MATNTKQSNLHGTPSISKSRLWAGTLAVVGILLIIWPLFFTTDIKQYHECIAYDLFPALNGYPSDSIKSFLFFVHLPSVILGWICISLGVAKLVRKSTLKDILLIFAGTSLGITVLFVFIFVARISLSYDTCADYRKNQLPDFPLIINSRTQ